FTGPLYTVYKALSAMALAARLERERRAPVVPVFWVAGDDHDFAEANHAWFLDKNGELAQAVLRERAAEAPLLPLAREPCGPEIAGVLRQLDEGTPDSEFKPGVLEWLGKCYRPEATLADAFAQALDALLGPRGLVVLRVHDPRAKRAAALYETLGVIRQAPVPRWSGLLVESRVDKLMERHGLDLAAFDGKPGELEARLVRDELPAETVATLAALRRGIEEHYAALRES